MSETLLIVAGGVVSVCTLAFVVGVFFMLLGIRLDLRARLEAPMPICQFTEPTPMTCEFAVQQATAEKPVAVAVPGTGRHLLQQRMAARQKPS